MKKQPLPAVAQKIMNEAVARLKMLESKFGFEFAVVARDYGVKEGSLAPKDFTSRKQRVFRNPNARYGTVSSYLRPIMQDLEEDQFIEIPYNGFNPKTVYSSVHSIATRSWGPGTFVIARNTKHLELWRTTSASTLTASANVDDEALDDAL